MAWRGRRHRATQERNREERGCRPVGPTLERNPKSKYKFHSNLIWSKEEFLELEKFGQGVLKDGLQTLLFDLGDMHKQSSNMEEDIEFQTGQRVRFCNLPKVWKIRYPLALFGPLKQLLPELQIFC
jgi:hypothetical protein